MFAYSTLVAKTPPPASTDAVPLIIDNAVSHEFLADAQAVQASIWQRAGGQMTPALWDAFEHLRRARWRYLIDELTPEVREWAETAQCLVVAENDVTDPQGRSVFAADFALTKAPDAVARAQRIRAELKQSRNITVPDAFPTSVDESQALPHSAHDVGLRALGLGLSALYSQALLANLPEDAAAMRDALPHAYAALTPSERPVFDHRDHRVAGILVWRVEAAKTLLWALGKLTDLGAPIILADVDPIYAALFSQTEAEFLHDLVLRPIAEILDEHERNRSLLWAVRQPGPVVPAAHPDVLSERCMALEWLLERPMNFDDAHRFF